MRLTACTGTWLALRMAHNERLSQIMHRLAALTILALSAPCFAQTDTTSKPRPHLCWRGKPAPDCTTFWITEFGYDAMVARSHTRIVQDFGSGGVSSYTAPDFESHLVWTVGPMFNTGPGRAVGGTLSFAPTNGDARIAAEARRRWWTGEGPSIDLSGGLVRMTVPQSSPSADGSAYGMTVGGYIVGGDLINVNARTDLLFSGGKTRVGTSLGVGLDSYAAAGGTVVAGALVLVLLASISRAWD
jgi:hypothetical protein